MKPIRHSYVDGSSAEIYDDGRWDFTLPSGKHLRGQSADVESARLAVNVEHDKFVLSCWRKGTLAAKSNFICPLT